MRTFRHYKGKLYVVIDDNVLDDNGVRCVVYRATAEGQLFVQPHERFFGPADGMSAVPRFELIGTA